MAKNSKRSGIKKGKTVRKKKDKPIQVDGLGAKDLKRIRTALRQVWSWSHPWRLVKARAMHGDGFPRCENKRCIHRGKPVPKVFVDHVNAIGSLDTVDNPLFRMFIPSKDLQALCKQCHNEKTKRENAKKKKRFKFTDQF